MVAWPERQEDTILHALDMLDDRADRSYR